MYDKKAIVSRLLSSRLRSALAVTPVVVLTGARQTGKSTLVGLEPIAGGRTYTSLDDLSVLEQAQKSPDDLVRRAPQLTVDEVQRSPNLLLAIKRVVDEGRRPGRFLLTGSANLLLMQKINETLAGRAQYTTLWPMTRREQFGLGRCGCWQDLFATERKQWLELFTAPASGMEPETWSDLARRGGYPVPAYCLENTEEREQWFAGYAQTYLERDLSDLAAIEHLADFRRLMRACCLRIGNLLNQSELARDVGLSQSTAQRYVNLLEVSYQLVRLPPFAVNRTKRLIKAPKLYWSDTGLAMYLAGESQVRGAHLENVVLCDLLAWRDSEVRRPEVLYWRTTKGAEVDFVIERDGELLAVEVKAGQSVGHRDTQHLRSFLLEYPESARGALILYTGEQTYWATPEILVVPWWRVI